jgi:hypothetical protein
MPASLSPRGSTSPGVCRLERCYRSGTGSTGGLNHEGGVTSANSLTFGMTSSDTRSMLVGRVSVQTHWDRRSPNRSKFATPPL